MRFADAISDWIFSRTDAFWTAALVLCSLLTAISESSGQADLESVGIPADNASPTIHLAPSVSIHEHSRSVATDPSTPRLSYSPEDITRLAISKASLVILMRGDLQADQKGVLRPSKQEQAILNLRSKVQEFRIARQSQIVAAQALELHFGLATLDAIQPIQLELESILLLAGERQDRAIERGLSIFDPTAIQRVMATSKDASLQSQSKASQLRSQLALLVGPSVACHYQPEPMCKPDCVTTSDHCQLIEIALRQRCDLAGLVYLRSRLDDDTLDVARWMSDILSGTASLAPNIALKPYRFLKLVSSKEKTTRQEELCTRLLMLDQATKTLREKIASEVDIALNKQATAASRYKNSLTQVELRQTRLAQLRAYGDQVKAFPADELEAEIQLIEARSELVQRQGDWHQAVVELALAIGCLR